MNLSLLTMAVSLLLLQLSVAARNASEAQTVCQGCAGLPGRDGRDGKDGTPGAPGPAGSPGASEISYTAYQELSERLSSELLGAHFKVSNASVSELEAEIEDLKGNLSYLSNIVKALQQNPPESAMADDTCPQILPKAASSCKEIYDCNPDSPSGYYWRDSSPPELMYCAMNLTRCGNITGGWTRVAHIDMTSPEGTCPSPLNTIASPRSCSRAGGRGCSSVSYSTFGLPFSQVCGQAIGYQYRSTDAFGGTKRSQKIDRPYVEGLSITYDTPRRHLWTYAVGNAKSMKSHKFNCPCAAASGAQPPSFVEDHYYCESGNVGGVENQWYTDDPLWDGDGCPTGNTCCDPPNLPWFNRIIDPPSTADIVLRVCRDEDASNEDVSVELFELYIY